MATKSNRETLLENIEQQIAELREGRIRDDKATDIKVATLEDVIKMINAQPKRNGKKKEGECK